DIIDTKGPKGCRTLLDPASVDRQHLVTTQEPIQLGLGLFGILNRNGEEAKCHMWSLVHMSISNFSPGAAPLPFPQHAPRGAFRSGSTEFRLRSSLAPPPLRRPALQAPLLLTGLLPRRELGQGGSRGS